MSYKPKVLEVAAGGTGAATLTNHGVLLGQSTSAVTATAAGTSGQILQSGGASANPAYTTSTYPATNSSNDIIYGSGSNAYGNLTVGTVPGAPLLFNGTALQYYNPNFHMQYVEDFFATNSGVTPWRKFNFNGGDFDSPVEPDSGHPGVVQLETGTSTNGYCALGLQNVTTTTGSVILGGGAIDLYMVFKLSNLSDGTDTYQIAVGFGDSTNTPPPFDNGVFLNYSSTVNSGNWQMSTASSSTRTTSNSATAATTNWTTVRINVNAGATLCTYYVNGVSLGTISTNIPTTTIGPFFVLSKSAGTANRFLKIDLVYMFQQLTSSR